MRFKITRNTILSKDHVGKDIEKDISTKRFHIYIHLRGPCNSKSKCECRHKSCCGTPHCQIPNYSWTFLFVCRPSDHKYIILINFQVFNSAYSYFMVPRELGEWNWFWVLHGFVYLINASIRIKRDFHRWMLYQNIVMTNIVKTDPRVPD